MLSARPILLVEDDRLDVMVVRRVLRELQADNNLVHVENGEEALAYLRRNARARPCLILLDLNMPKMNGFEFLIRFPFQRRRRSQELLEFFNFRRTREDNGS